MSKTFIIFTSLFVTLGFCTVVPRSEFQDGSDKTLQLKNKIHPEEMKIPSYEKSIEFLFPKNTTGKVVNNTLDLIKQNDSLKDEVLDEQNAKKKSNIDERSFIFIEQKYKVPMMNHRHSVQHPYGNNNYRTFISSHNEDIISNEEFSNINSRIMNSPFLPPLKEYNLQPALVTKPYFVNELYPYQPRKNLDKESDEIKMNVQIANDMIRKQYQDTTGLQGRPIIENSVSQQHHPMEFKHKTNDKQEKVPDAHRDYVELLKPPIVRPESNGDAEIKHNDIDDGIYEDNIDAKFGRKISRPYSKYGFIRPFAINGNDFQEEHDDDVIAALQTTDDKADERIVNNTVNGNVIDRKTSYQNQLPQICKNFLHKMNPRCKCAKFSELSSKTGEINNAKPATATAPETYMMTSPLRIIRGPDSDDTTNKSNSTE